MAAEARWCRPAKEAPGVTWRLTRPRRVAWLLRRSTESMEADVLLLALGGGEVTEGVAWEMGGGRLPGTAVLWGPVAVGWVGAAMGAHMVGTLSCCWFWAAALWEEESL